MRIKATNVIGTGSYSILSDGTALIVSVPSAPSPPVRDISSSRTSIVLDITAPTGQNTGGVPITGYDVYWNGGGTGTTFTLLQQITANTITVSTTERQTYIFKVAAINEVGTGSNSASYQTVSAIIPSAPDSVTTEIVSSSVKISWVQSDDGGSSITQFNIYVQDSSGTYQSVSSYWNGADPTIISQLYCYISLSVLTSSPFSLVQGTTIIVKVEPVNIIGTGTSNQNTLGALIEVPPLKPSSVPLRINSLSTKTAIAVSYQALTGTNTGGSPILSYELQWDQGTGTWASLVGYNPYSTATSFVTPSTLTTGNQYQFKYRAVNAGLKKI